MPHQPTLLITRPEPDAKNSAMRFEKAGFNVVAEPILKIEPLIQANESAIDKESYEALLITSRNAIRIATPIIAKDTPILCVGSKTMAVIREFGFENVTHIEGNSDDLANFISKNYSKKIKKMLWLCGKHHNSAFLSQLETNGYKIEQKIVYQANATDHLSAKLVQRMQNRAIDGVLFYSKRSAQMFLDFVKEAHILDTLNSIYAFSLSSDIAQSLNNYDFKNNLHSASQSEDSLLEFIANFQFTDAS